MADLLLELFSEEIPARMQKDAMTHLDESITKKLAEAGIAVTIQAFVTPRRVTVWAKNLPAAQPDVTTELKGPKVGAPQAALDGFLKKTGLAVEQLEQRDGVYFATVHQKGKATADILKPLIESILASFPWPKSMRWGAGEQSWVRPLHSILCTFDGKVIAVEFAGIKASNTTRGHRFLSPEVITVANPAEYESALEKAHVTADREKRKAVILQQAQTIAGKLGLALKDDIGLLEEVTGLVEYPNLLVGTIDKNYMDLPKEVLISEMRAHQKYFALLNKDGSLADKFLITANTSTNDQGKFIIAGNERVLRARLADGRFFWDQDRKRSLDEMAKGLASVTYHAKLGSIADKVARIEKLALQLADSIKGADKKLTQQAASLCKADLVSGMVGEFPELQGVMGRYYAKHQKLPDALADAIADHYKPQGPGDSVPNAPVSVCVALADKLDTLISMFAIGEKPTGSKDPFALRRAALGVIRIILENNVRLPLRSCFEGVPGKNIALHSAHEKLAKKVGESLKDASEHKVGKYLTVNESATTDLEEVIPSDLADMLYGFFIDRLSVQLKDQGIRHDVIKAATANGDDDLVRIVARAKAVQDFLATDDGANLLAAYKRAANILAIEEKKDKTSYKSSELQASALKEKEEKELAQTLEKTAAQLAPLLEGEKFAEAMKSLALLRTVVDHFFEKIMVNADDKDLRANRLRLLARIKADMDSIASFAAIEG
ncbi:MAG: glycine--tRNA ligase subunit beta [Rickettsiales bacterium]|nr:glycine--tRNA ligase subunit beta [Rickettsiales bacterium]